MRFVSINTGRFDARRYPSSETDSHPYSTSLIGGVNLIFDSGSYDLSNYGFGSYLIAASFLFFIWKPFVCFFSEC